MDEHAVPGQQLVTVADHAGDPPADAPGALITPEMRLDLMAARLEGLAAQNRRLTHDNDDLRQENRRLLASASQLRGENLALSRALAPASATAEELQLLSRQLEAFGEAMQAERAAREHAGERSKAEIAAAVEAAATQAADNVAASHTNLSPETIERLVEALTRQATDARNGDATAMLDAMQRSTSWRVTKPIRAAGRVFRRS